MGKAIVGVGKRLQVWHFPQIGMRHFGVDVINEIEAYKIIQVLANQHLFLHTSNLIADFSNILRVMMWCDNCEENGGPGWVDYENDGMSWEELEAECFPDGPPYFARVIKLSSLEALAESMFPNAETKKAALDEVLKIFYEDNQIYTSPDKENPLPTEYT